MIARIKKRGHFQMGLETSRKLTRVGGLALPGVFTREENNPSAMATVASRYGNHLTG